MSRHESDLPAPPTPGASHHREPRVQRSLVIVSEYPILIASIRSAVVGTEFTIVGAAMTHHEMPLLLESHPDAVLLLATHDPAAPLSLVRERFPNVPAIVFDDSATPETARVALSQGARGFVASTIESRRKSRIARPTTSSARPRAYTFAVSKNVTPRSYARTIQARAASSSTLLP